jgi:hypothetical protein
VAPKEGGFSAVNRKKRSDSDHGGNWLIATARRGFRPWIVQRTIPATEAIDYRLLFNCNRARVSGCESYKS